MTKCVGKKSYNVCFVGAGLVGTSTAAVLALKNPTAVFTVVDIDTERIRSWKSHDIPVKEPGLFDIILKVSDAHTMSNGHEDISAMTEDEANGRAERLHPAPQCIRHISHRAAPCTARVPSPNLHFSTDVNGAIAAADMVFITVNTPSKYTNFTYVKASPMSHELDLSYFDTVLELIAGASTGNKVIVQKSTVPCGNALRVSKMLKAKAKPNASFTILSNPEFLNAGTAIEDLLAPYSIIIGSPSARPRSDPDTMSLVGLYSLWVAEEKIRLMPNSSCELIKIANNAFEAQRISSINSLSTICEKIGANITEISHTLGMNPNIGPRFLRAGVGFGGSCLRKDTLGLSAIATHLGIPEVAEYWRQVAVINDFQIDRFTKRVCHYSSRSSSRAVAIFGFAFKKDTNDSRESIARGVILELLEGGATVAVHDPLISANTIEGLLPMTSKLRVCQTPYEACRGAETIAILNESTEYTSLDWGLISANMTGENKVVVDGRNIVDDLILENLGLKVEKLGKPM